MSFTLSENPVRRGSRARLTSCAILMASLMPLAPARANDVPPPLHALTYSGDQRGLATLDAEIAAAGNDAQKLATIEMRLLAGLRRSDATFAARQAICERLAVVLAQGTRKITADALKPLPAMLADERDTDLARLALERVPGEVVDGIFVAALENATGRVRLGLIHALAARRAPGAVATLATFLKDPDSAAVAAAIRALGEIGTKEALAALRTAPAQSAPEVATAKLAAAHRLPTSEAKSVLGELQRDAHSTAHQVAALRLSLERDRGGAPARILEVLSGNNWAMKQAAFDAIATLPADGAFTTQLASKLPTFDAATQVAAIATLARRPEAAAVSALTGAAAHDSGEVRAAALHAIGFMPGTRELALLLARVASGTTDDARIARHSLARLNGPEVGPAILAGAERGEPALRVAFLEQLALRNMTEGVPLLLTLRTDANAAVRAAALGALGELGSAKQQQTVIDWAMTAADELEQARGLRAIVTLTQRLPDEATRGRPVFAALERAAPDVAVRTLPVLLRLGGEASAECAARLAVRNDASLAESAVDTLGRWTDNTALRALATVAEKAALGDVKTSAWQAAVRYLERNREPWSPNLTDAVARLLATAPEPKERARVAALLPRANDKRALAVAENLQGDPELGDTARDAAAAIRANLAGPPLVRASGNSAALKNIFDGKTSTRWNVNTVGEEWLELDFRLTRPFRKLTLDQTGRAGEHPERYEVFVTDDLREPGAAVVTGTGHRTRTVIDLPPGTRGRYVIIKNTEERKDSAWSVCELYVD